MSRKNDNIPRTSIAFCKIKPPAMAAKKHDIDADARERLALRFRSAQAILDICLVAAICLALLLVSWLVTTGG